jgi:hypothetical protein
MIGKYSKTLVDFTHGNKLERSLESARLLEQPALDIFQECYAKNIGGVLALSSLLRLFKQ